MAKKKGKFSRIERTACHEAGHAVMCYLLRQRFKYITIAPHGDFLGRVHTTFSKDYWKDVDLAPMPAKIEKSIRISLAGLVAEAIATGRHDWKFSGQDLHDALNVASCMIGPTETAAKYIEYLLLSVRDDLSLPHQRRMVSDLTTALLKEKTIGYQKARAIMKKAWDHEMQDALRKAGDQE